MPKHRLLTLIVFSIMAIEVLSASKTLAQNCYCDVSTSCDQLCCCDGDCSSTATTYWSNYNLCANDGFAIPFCSTYSSTSLHVHDLSQGLRLIYTIIKRLFCVSRTNFVSPSSDYQTTSTDQQVPTTPSTTSAVNQHVLDLTSISTYPSLPVRDSLGLCQSSSNLRDMNSVSDKCRTLVSQATLAANPLMVPNLFVTANNLDVNSLMVYRMTSTSLTGTSVNSFTLGGCTLVSGSGSTYSCQAVRQIKLFFIQSTATIDYTSSYLVVGQVLINLNTYVSVQYSYAFISAAGTYSYPSYQGYTIGTPLNLLLITNSTKIFNPVNLAFRNTDGTCRTAGTENADIGNLVHLNFGVNSVYSCIGTSSTMLSSNLLGMFDYVGGLGISSTVLADYVQLTTTTIPSNENIQLVFYYIPIGTELDPQYQIVNAKLQPAGTISTTVNLYVQYEAISSGVFMNVPSPPTINAQLPSDFLYPFYVA